MRLGKQTQHCAKYGPGEFPPVVTPFLGSYAHPWLQQLRYLSGGRRPQTLYPDSPCLQVAQCFNSLAPARRPAAIGDH